MGVTDDFAPSFTQKPQLRQEDDGNRLLFECQLLASPQPDIEWYRSDELLKEDSRTKFKIQSLGDNKYFVVLDLDDVVETDAGLYKVKAKNKMGEVAASINLNFSRKLLFHYAKFPIENSRVSVSSTENENHFWRPQIHISRRSDDPFKSRQRWQVKKLPSCLKHH